MAKKESLTKADLVRAVAVASCTTQKEAAGAVEAVLEAIMNAVSSGKKVSLVGFGVFEAKKRAPRQGRNPQMPEMVVEIPERVVPVFKPGKEFREKVEEKVK